MILGVGAAPDANHQLLDVLDPVVVRIQLPQFANGLGRGKRACARQKMYNRHV